MSVKNLYIDDSHLYRVARNSYYNLFYKIIDIIVNWNLYYYHIKGVNVNCGYEKPICST